MPVYSVQTVCACVLIDGHYLEKPTTNSTGSFWIPRFNAKLYNSFNIRRANLVYGEQQGEYICIVLEPYSTCA